MNENDSLNPFDWDRIFSTANVPGEYLWEIAFRTTFMFLLLILALKFLSKRGVKQLSVFELAILIALGSAIGDHMFYSFIPLTYGVIVLTSVILLYWFITFLSARSRKLEELLEGNPICIVDEGIIHIVNHKKLRLPHDKLFAEFRLKGIDHLGQVRKAYIESSGEISIYMYGDEDVKAGLPIYPELIDNPIAELLEEKDYSCTNCGSIQLNKTGPAVCKRCGKDQWLAPDNRRRVQ